MMYENGTVSFIDFVSAVKSRATAMLLIE